MEKVKLSYLKRVLEKSWSKETSADPKKWSSKNPAWGQCVVTALVVQDFFGGKLLKGIVRIEDIEYIDNVWSHYWNQLPNGKERDLTRDQFPKKTIMPQGDLAYRKYVLSYPNAVKRYKILKERVEDFLENHGEKRRQKRVKTLSEGVSKNASSFCFWICLISIL